MVKIFYLAMPTTRTKKTHSFKLSFGVIKSVSIPHLDFGKHRIALLICYTLTSNFGRCKTQIVKAVQLKHPVNNSSSPQTVICVGASEGS